ASLAGGAVMTVALTAVADRVGRRRVQLAGAVLMLLGGLLFAATDHLALLVIAATVGAISPSGKDVGPFLAVELAMLPEPGPAAHRPRGFATSNLVGALAGAFGALAAGAPAALGMAPLAGYRALVWGYAVAAVLLLALYGRLSPRVESAPGAGGEPRHWL